MNGLECECSDERAKDIGKPVVNVIAAASGRECLVPLIQPANASEQDYHGEDDFSPCGLIRFESEKRGGEESATAEKIPKMLDFVHVLDGRWRAASHGK